MQQRLVKKSLHLDGVKSLKVWSVWNRPCFIARHQSSPPLSNVSLHRRTVPLRLESFAVQKDVPLNLPAPASFIEETRQPSGRLLKCLSVLGILLCLGILVPSASFASTSQTSAGSTPNLIKRFFDFFLHLDKHLSAIIARYGMATYGILFGIVFCETGLVLTPLLPGDSLLFAAGTMAGLGKLNVVYLFAVFIISAILGDAVNYAIGSWLGEKAVNSKFISKSAIEKTEEFYAKHGGKTIVLARFVPIVRTFAPFVAGVSHMAYRAFAAYNVGGAILWTVLFCGAGYYFGNLPFVEKNFSVVVLAIVVVSILPTVFELMAARQK